MTTTYYKATFSDGTVLRRSTTSRKYTHAYLARGKHANAERGWQQSGFCGREQLARQQLSAASRWSSTFAELAPAIEITRKEYLEREEQVKDQLVETAVRLLKQDKAYLRDAREGVSVNNTIVGSVLSLTHKAPRWATENAVREALKRLKQRRD